MLKRCGCKSVHQVDPRLASCRCAVSLDTLLPVVAARRNDSETVKTTVELPGELWRAAKINAMDQRSDLRSVLIRALGYLRGDTRNGSREARRAMTEPWRTTTCRCRRRRPCGQGDLAAAGDGCSARTLFFTVVMIVDALAGEQGLLALLQARREYAALEQPLSAPAPRTPSCAKARRLREEPADRRLARRQLGLIKPGEMVFFVKDIDKKPW